MQEGKKGIPSFRKGLHPAFGTPVHFERRTRGRCRALDASAHNCHPSCDPSLCIPNHSNTIYAMIIFPAERSSMLKLAVRAEYRIRGRCSRHPAYNPVKDEQGGIRGGCKSCHELLNAYRAYVALRKAMEEFETTAQPFLAIKKAQRKSADGPPAAAPALPMPAARRGTPENGI